MNWAAIGFWWQVAVTGFLLLWVGSTFLNAFVFRRPRRRTAVDLREPPLVSVLIPARNEELRLPACLDSLLAQDYPRCEILVLDDHSTDGTARVAEERGFRREADAPRRLLSGEPLPPGWTGKSWACQQLGRAARGDYLLFVDADTQHQPHGISTAVAEAIESRRDLLSAWPRQHMGTWSERLVIPFIWLLIATFMPHALCALPQRYPRLSRLFPRRMWWTVGGAVGQFLLFRRASYLAIGGHEVVRDHLVEDVELGRQVAARFADGMRLLNCDGADIVHCRMYTSFPELWEGFSKNIRPAFDERIGAFIFFGTMQFACFILPFLLLPFSFTGAAWAPWTWAQVGLVLGLRAYHAVRFHTPWSSVLLHPFGHLLALAIGLNSWRLSAKKGVTWKGRSYTMQRPPGADAKTGV